jgi:Galactose oxidase, central domain/Kelch motif
MKATVTLSLGNVDFTLSPSSSLSGVSDGQGMVNFRPDRECEGAYILELTSFTGTLRVVATEPLATPKHLKTNDKRRLDHETASERPQLDCSASSKRIRTVAESSKDGSEDELLPTETSGSFCGGLGKISRYNTDVDASSSLLASPASSEASLSLPLAAATTLGQPDWSQTQSIDDSNGTKPLEQPNHSSHTVHDLVDNLVGRARISIGNSPHVEPQSTTNTTDDASQEQHDATHPTLPGEGRDHKENSELRTPCPRWGHSMTLLDENRVLVYGGQSLDTVTKFPATLSDVHVHHHNESLSPSDDAATLSWVQPFHCHGFPRQWHSATYLPDRRLLICLGGESVLRDSPTGATPRTNGGSRRYPAADQRELEAKASVMVLDTEIMVWYPPTVSGHDSPMKHRSGHSATLLRDDQGRDTGIVVVFGGVRNKRNWLNSISLLDCTLWKWYNVPKSAVVGSAPPPRSYHSAVALNGFGLVVFGGNNQNQCWDSVHVLQRTRPASDAAISKTELLLHQEEADDASEGEEGDPALFCWQWSHPNTSGSGPCARTGHTAVLLENGSTIWIHGGWDPNEDDDHVFGDSFYLDTITWTWTKGPTVPGISKRVGHTAVLFPKKNKPAGNGAGTSKIAVFGGRVPGSQFSGDLVTLSV